MQHWFDFLCWIEKHPGLAAWTQAFGAVVAIAVAIYIPWSQNRATVRRQVEISRAEVRALLEILRIEMKTNLAALQSQVGPMLEAGGGNNAFLAEYPVPSDPTGMFTILLPKIGTVEPAALRAKIIEATGHCGSLAMQFQYNNRLLSEWRELRRVYDGTKSDQAKTEAAEALMALQHFGPSLHQQWLLTKQQLNETIEALNTALGSDSH